MINKLKQYFHEFHIGRNSWEHTYIEIIGINSDVEVGGD